MSVIANKSRPYSYSSIQTYAACPTRYFFKYVACLSPLQESEHDLRYGKAWDCALNTHYQGGSVTEAQQAFVASYPASEYPAQLPFWSPGKSLANGLQAIPAYVEKWREDDSQWEVLAVQDRDTNEDGDRVVVLDLVVRDRRDGLVYGVDNKSTGKYLDAKYASQFDPHSQVRSYVARLQELHGEVAGFYINAASFRHRSKAYTPRSGPDKGVQLPAGDWFDFKRWLFNPNAEAVSAERSSFANWVAKIELDKKQGSWSYNTDQCVRGEMVCPYHRLCSAGYSYPKDAMLVEQYYVRRCLELVDGERCWLEPEHEGGCDSTRPKQPDYEVDLSDDTIEDAEA
jgi:hypothetical protein